MSATLRARQDTRQYIHEGTVKNVLHQICEQAMKSGHGIVLDQSVTVSWATRPGGLADMTVVLAPGSRIGQIHSCDPQRALAFRFESTTGRQLVIYADDGKMWVVRD